MLENNIMNLLILKKLLCVFLFYKYTNNCVRAPGLGESGSKIMTDEREERETWTQLSVGVK